AELAGRIEAARVECFRELARQADRTVVHKFRVAGADVAYLGRGEVPGRVLDQFSMDEYGGHFRSATTTEGFLFPERPATRNNVFVLDENLQVVGRLTGLALSERIYAARFTGDRAYLVTFRVVDPLFVVDLRDPRQPRVLGELKIPGYSEYLHPYDENHLIGIGREAAEAPVPAGQGTLIFPPPVVDRGLKVALFDVSDPA
ncbi:MAG: beta-propeller domain-containing protein, partial [Firmicutes bacterium]|nr:beta-propeller domain-containing protein [Bacillota bacterium]